MKPKSDVERLTETLALYLCLFAISLGIIISALGVVTHEPLYIRWALGLVAASCFFGGYIAVVKILDWIDR